MLPQFNFIGFTPDEIIRKKASRIIDQLLDISPYGSTIVAVMQKDGSSFQCAIEIHSKQGPFVVQAPAESPDAALDRVYSALLKKIDRWKSSRQICGQIGGMANAISVA